MKLKFNIDYYTPEGEGLYILGSIDRLGAGEIADAFPMSLSGHERWTAELDVPASVGEISYSYFVRRADGSILHEWGSKHTLSLPADVPTISVLDRWQEMPSDKPFYSSAFTESIFRRKDRSLPVAPAPGLLTFEVNAPMIAPDERVAIVGSVEALGMWDPDKAPEMSDYDFPVWKVDIPLNAITNETEFKFIIKKSHSGAVEWENGPNRHFSLPKEASSEALIDRGSEIRNPLTPWRGAGVAIPVFSLRSDDDFGVGDFFDLKLMIDWAAATSQNIVQVLPINDTTLTGTCTDSYPYNAISTFALHPMYLRVQEMGILKDQERRRHYAELARELNRHADVEYEAVNKAKNAYTRELFKQDGPKVLSSPEFKSFLEKNSDWLMPYAAWCILRDFHHTPYMGAWGEYEEYDEAKISLFIKEHKPEADYICYLQYFLDKQLREVRDYAHKKGVALKGDIPIGIALCSVDAWLSPRLFNLDCQAGAPPDVFAVLGQNWGFPTYNWAEMALDGFAWWKARFRKMAEYFDAYRIDHVLGFFRIWQIPCESVHGLLGIFNRALPFTPEELQSDYGFFPDPASYTSPFISDAMLRELLPEDCRECRELFLNDEGCGRYSPKAEFSSQRKIADYFASLPKDDHNIRMSNALMLMLDEVLFIEDPYEKGKYHPRISGRDSYVYRSLAEEDRQAFDRLYEDFYYHRMDEFWREKALWKLPPLIDSTSMLVCAEDLGMIPGCVPEVMDKLRILTLEIQRMSKDPSTRFGRTDRYPYLSVCTTSTHDMDGIRRWWESDRADTQRYFNEVLGENGEAPFFAEPWICERIIRLHLESPSMLCILPLQDWLSIDGVIRRRDPREELINIPANPRHYWRYRMHITLENLLAQTELNARIRTLIRSTR